MQVETDFEHIESAKPDNTKKTVVFYTGEVKTIPPQKKQMDIIQTVLWVKEPPPVPKKIFFRKKNCVLYIIPPTCGRSTRQSYEQKQATPSDPRKGLSHKPPKTGPSVLGHLFFFLGTTLWRSGSVN